MNILLPKKINHAIIALGGDLKCQPAFACDEQVKMLDIIGDLALPETQDALEDLMDRYHPDVLVCDRHPGYFSNNLAHRLALEKGIRLLEVQHHEAHIAAVCLEHEIYDVPVVGLAFDGTGYGDDGNAWGGEFFSGSVKNGFCRNAHFAPLPIPGGDAAVRQPWRIALALMLGRDVDQATIMSWMKRCNINLADVALFQKALNSGFGVGRSSSLGRWFDAISALLGIGPESAFEAQAAIKLQQAAEAMIGKNVDLVCPVSITESDPLIIDYPNLALLARTEENDAPAMAYAFHTATAQVVADVANDLAEQIGTKKVIASGGCFLNRLFANLLEEHVNQHGLNYIKPIDLPPGDQAIALGQIGLVLNKLHD